MTVLRCVQVLPHRSELTNLASYSLVGPDRSQIAVCDAVQTTVELSEYLCYCMVIDKRATMAAIPNDLHSL